MIQIELQIEVRLLYIYKYGMIYREVMNTPRIDFCELMDEKDFSNKVVLVTSSQRYCSRIDTRVSLSGLENLINMMKCNIKTKGLPSVFASGEILQNVSIFWLEIWKNGCD